MTAACSHESLDGIDRAVGPGKVWRCNECAALVTAWLEAVTRFLDGPVVETPDLNLTPQRDLLQRHLLRAATGLHDRGPDGRCRDCLVLLGPDAALCANDGSGIR